MSDPKPKRLTSAELVRLADGTVAAVKKLALHLAAVEAELEASETGHHNLAAHTESNWRAERDHLRACLGRVEGALTDAESVPVHSDALWISVQKLTDERDNWRGRAARAEDIAAQLASVRDQALEDAAKECERVVYPQPAFTVCSARIRALKGGAKCDCYGQGHGGPRDAIVEMGAKGEGE